MKDLDALRVDMQLSRIQPQFLKRHLSTLPQGGRGNRGPMAEALFRNESDSAWVKLSSVGHPEPEFITKIFKCKDIVYVLSRLWPELRRNL